MPKEQLPVVLPTDLRIDGTGRPLAEREDFVNTELPVAAAGRRRRETDTLDCHVDAFWTWLSIAVPYADRARAACSTTRRRPDGCRSRT